MSVSAAYKNSKGINEFGKLVETNGDLGTGSTKKSELLVTDDRVMEVYRADEQAQEEYIKKCWISMLRNCRQV